MGTLFRDYLAEQLKDPEFKKEYDALQPEYDLMCARMNANNGKGMTQKELAERSGISQGDISKIETGNANPSLKTLQRLAAGMGTVLHLQFVPENE